MFYLRGILLLVFLIAIDNPVISQSSFVKRADGKFILDKKDYYYIGTNYWYGPYLGLIKDSLKGIKRLQAELDFLKAKGVTNLRVLAGVEGEGQINGVKRVEPPLQIKQGKFNADALNGLDILLDEMGKRNMKAVIFLSNNWEWSGGFLQYLNWNGLIADSVMRRKLDWDEMRNYVSEFYSCKTCIKAYLKQVSYILNRKNKINHLQYKNDPAIMAWELANEPRPMRPSANNQYCEWINSTAAYIKKTDKKHLITLGVEGEMGTEGMGLFEKIHSGKNIDYLTIHIWPKNWGWFKGTDISSSLNEVIQKTAMYINGHEAIAKKINKPLVIEEFGLPRDGHSFSPESSVTLRNQYYSTIFSAWKNSRDSKGVIAGCNFWTFGGMGKPIKGQVFWKEGDDYLGDPPMEEQGLNSVFESDASTWKMIESFIHN
jgi:mannan endo-1,4-beta-mannosidase